jgi:hypothetical protein
VPEVLDAAAKAKLREAVREALREGLDARKAGIMSAFSAYHRNLNGCMTALEAKLENTDARLSGRVAIVERRLQELEKRFLLNPPAA